MDRRSAKTKKLLENALIKLMIEKGFDKISIKDLTNGLKAACRKPHRS